MSNRSVVIKKSAFWGCLGTFAVLFAAAILFPVFAKARIGGGPNRCLGNVFTMSRAFLIYDSDYDALPPAGQWTDDLSEYVPPKFVFRCPQVSKDQPYASGYAMRTRLGGKPLDKLKHPEKEALVFDSWPLGKNAHTDVVTIPISRHYDGQSVGFADGHARKVRQK